MVARDLIAGENAAAALAELIGYEVNYDPADVRAPAWTFDKHVAHVGTEGPGPPEPGGLWERARRILHDYEFSPPELIRAVYDAGQPLQGRNILLEGRFYGLRFHLPVRITQVTDRDTAQERRWGWAYETLGPHLERGKVRYEIVKLPETGVVQFEADVYSQHAPTLPAILRLGWAVFGRRTQLQFYRRIGERMRELATSTAPPPPQTRRGSLVLVPSGVAPSRLDRIFTIRSRHPADSG